MDIDQQIDSLVLLKEEIDKEIFYLNEFKKLNEQKLIYIPSENHLGKNYVLDATSKSCSCPSYKFSSPKKRKTCKHLEKYEFEIIDNFLYNKDKNQK